MSNNTAKDTNIFNFIQWYDGENGHRNTNALLPAALLYPSRMASSGMLCGAALVRTDISEELSACFIRVTRIGEPGTTLAVTSN
jgi:hypothetical protein